MFCSTAIIKGIVSRINIDLCFPDLSKKVVGIYKKNIILFGRVVFDTGIAWFWSDKK